MSLLRSFASNFFRKVKIKSTAPSLCVNALNKSYVRKVLPPELSRNTAMLRCQTAANDGGVCDVYLVGTIHVSKKSSQQVRDVIQFVKPQAVFLELCSSRSHCLFPAKKDEEASFADLVKELKKLNPISLYLGLIYVILICKLELWPGGEFLAAYEEAVKHGACVFLGDIDTNITMQRIWCKMSLWHKTKFIIKTPYALSVLCFTSAERLNQRVKKFDDDDYKPTPMRFPSHWDPLVQERDQYMSAKLLEVARRHKSVVAVVGRGHLEGIQKYWEQPIDVEKLLTIPSQEKRKPVGETKTESSCKIFGPCADSKN